MPLPTKTITFPNGETRNDVPVDINTFEEYERYINSPYNQRAIPTIERDPDPRPAEEYGAGTRDFKRIFRSMVGIPAEFAEAVIPLDAAANLDKTAQELYGEDFYDLGIGERMDRVRVSKARQASARAAEGKFSVNPTLEELDVITDEDGYVTQTETTLGLAGNIGSYVLGATGVLNGLRGLAMNAPRAFQTFVTNNRISARVATGIATGSITDQMLTNPNDPNLGSMGVDFVTKSLGMSDGMLVELGNYLKADEDDADAEKRLKMFLGHLPFEFIVGLGFYKLGDDLLPNPASKKEAVDEAVEGFKRMKVKTPTTQTALASGRVVDDAAEQAQVFNQEGFLTGLVQKFTQSRSFNTYAGQDAFEQAAQAGRKYRNRSSHTAKRLQVSMNNLLKEVDDPKIVDKVYEALTSEKVTIKSIADTRSEEALTNFLKREFGFSDDVAKGVMESRRLIDEMSGEIERYAPTKAVRQTIKDNVGVYLRRSYRQFEDERFAPSEIVRNKAQQYFYNTFKQADDERVAKATAKGKNPRPATDTALRKRAIAAVDEVQGIARAEGMAGLRESENLKKIFAERKDLDAPVRELLGEITDPEDLLTLTIDKMSRFYEKSKYYDDMNTLGAKQGWLFTSIPEGLDAPGKLVKITGTGSKLDGKFTTPRMSKAIRGKEVSLTGSEAEMGTIYRELLSLKGYTNRAATIYNWGTQVKNFMGAAIIGLANGTNPFRTGLLNKTILNTPEFADDTNLHFGKSLQTIENEITQGGDKALEELYEKYIGLGVINTNVRVGDFRALLEDGAASSKLTEFSTKVGDRISKKIGRGADFATKVYMASDDLFKINAFNNELDFIKRANKGSGRSLESLEREAADVVKNTVPNYDRVPKGIQALRNAPMGTFVSFPAEIIRTSYNIGRQALKELSSGNTTYMARGALRASGLVSTTTGFASLGEYASSKIGWTDDEYKAATQLVTTPWSGPENTRIFTQDDDGKIYYADTKAVDPYNTINEPIRAALNAYELGRLDEKGAAEAMVSGIGAAVTKLAAPFVSPAIVSQTIGDIYFAAQSGTGDAPDGTNVFNPNSPVDERYADMAYHMLSSFIPKTALGIDKLVRAADEERDAFTGEPKYDLAVEAQNFLSGISWREFDPERDLNFSISEYKEGMRNVNQVYPDYENSFRVYKKEILDEARASYEVQRELYKDIQASQYFMSDVEIYNQLQERGLNQDEAFDLIKGRTHFKEIDMDEVADISKRVGDAPDTWVGIQREIRDIQSSINRTLLNTPTEED